MPRIGALRVTVDDDVAALAPRAAQAAAAALAEAISTRGAAAAMLATGNSQRAFLEALTQTDVDWSRVTGFHLDEYVGISADRPASLRRYLRERFADRVPLRHFHFIAGDASDPDGEAARYGELLAATPIDLCCLGIGENGHLAFNDPPEARFDDPAPVKIVALAEASRRQQVGEGHFATLADVPTHAITVTIPTIVRAGALIAVVPERRKARAVQAALTGPVSPACPASILRDQPHAQLFLDRASASLLS